MPVKVRLKVGDVFAIPLADNKYGLALCTFVFRDFKNCIACRVFDAVTDEPKILDPMPLEIVIDPLFMGKQIISAGTWPIVGKMTVGAPVAFRVAGEKFIGDNHVGPAGTEALPELLAYGSVAVQNLLRRRFGLA
jgi:hypothetical protein